MQRFSPTIPKNQELPIGLDYFGLRAEGVNLLQALSGNVWTDYNEHDPGVTILEALCYALTDLSNRARQPIPDLLAPAPGQAPRADSPLVPAPAAFANHPVTTKDYRKIVLGDAELRQQVRNVWMKPRRDFPGQYIVRVGLYYDADTLRPPAPTGPPPGAAAVDRAALAGQLLRTLNQHRSLGEQFTKVVFLEPYLVGIGGRLDMQGTQLPEDVLAEALWRVYTIFQPTVARHALASWPSLPGRPEELLAGPLLDQELLLERDFRAQPRQLGTAQLHAELSTLPSLSGVDGLSLYEPGQTKPAVLVGLRNSQELLLDVESSLRRLSVSYRGALVSVNLEQARHKFEQRRAEQQRAQRQPLTTARAAAPEGPGRYLNLGRYDSIQHDFPAVYGLETDALPLGTSPARRAHTWQLKGYLLFFEQLMANFCAQLSHVETLLAAQPATHEQQLFAQRPTDVPDLEYLLDEPGRPLQPPTPDTRADELPEAAGAPDTTADFNHSYLHRLAEDPSALRRRRDKLLNHLLARFGYVIAPFHPAPSDPDGIPAHSLLVRERLLRYLNTVIYYRGAARIAPEKLPFESPYDVSGLELFLYLLTGIRYFPLISHSEQLAMLEQEVWLGQGTAAPVSAQLVVYGAELDFPTFLAVQQTLLTAPGLGKPNGPRCLALVDEAGQPTGLELELLAAHATPGSSAPQQVLRYLARLDERLNRFLLLDHCTLQPATPEAPADPEAPYSPYEFQISICLAAFTNQFQPLPGAPPNTPGEYQQYVQNLILTHAPAHLLVHIIWLNFAEMKDLEGHYEGFVAAGGLRLGDASRHPAQLLEKQHSLLEFLRPHWS